MLVRNVVLLAVGAAALLAAGLGLWALAPAEEAASLSATAPPVEGPRVLGLELEDAGDDARLKNGDYALKTATMRCRVTLGSACPPLGAVYSLPVPIHELGLPAPPALELLSARLEETPDALHVSLEVASLDESFAGAVEENVHWANYGVCWGRWEPTGECAYITAYSDAGFVAVEAAYDVYDPACNDWWWCTRGIPFEIEFGSPATLRFSIPRGIMATGAQGDALEYVGAFVQRLERQQPCCVGVGVSTPVVSRGIGPGVSFYEVDVAWTQDSFTFTTPRAEGARDAGETFPDYVEDSGDPELDIVRTTIVESPSALTYATQFREVREDPEDHGYIGFMSVTPSTLVYYFWFDAVNGTRVAEGGYCEYDADGACTWITIPVRLEVVPGPEGWVNMTLNRASLVPIRAGDATTMLWGASGGKSQAEHAVNVGVAYAVYASTLAGLNDWSAPLPAYVFRVDTEQAPAAPARVAVGDSRGDASLPVSVGDEYAGQFDILGVDVEGISPAATRVALGVADMAQVRVPVGYDAVFYSVGFGTPYGDVMVGYHKNSPSRGGGQEFFCAQDVANFGPQPGNPMDVVRIPIEGVIAVASSADDRARAGGSTSGAIVFHVPHDCFAEAPDGPIDTSRVAAGSFLVQDPTGQAAEVRRVDEMQTTEPFTLGGLGAVAPAGSGWYSRPFGIDNFWDMLGIGVAAVVSGAGLALVRRRRNVLKRYLADIERATVEHKDSAKARENALVAVQERLKKDVVRGAISEGHYGIVEQRLVPRLSEARAEGVTEAFGELPHRLLSKLQEMLADGVITPEEHRMFSAHLEDAELTSEAKARVRRKLALWVRDQDAK